MNIYRHLPSILASITIWFGAFHVAHSKESSVDEHHKQICSSFNEKAGPSPLWFYCKIFTKDLMGTICSSGRVNRKLLAEQIRAEARIPTDEIDGVEYGQIQDNNFKYGQKDQEPSNVETISYIATNFVHTKSKHHYSIHSGLNEFLARSGGNEYYEVTPAFDRYEEKAVTKYFRNEPAIHEIICLKAEASEGKKEKSATLGNFEKIQELIRIRKGVEELKLDKSDVKKAHGAQFSMASDNIKKSDSFGIEGVFGIAIAGSSESKITAAERLQGENLEESTWLLNIVPFVYTKRIKDAKNDIEIISPGILGNMTWVAHDGMWAFDLQIEGAPVYDTKSASEIYSARASWSPTILLGNHYLFDEAYSVGPVRVVADATALLSYSHVQDVGTNINFVGVNEFIGVGYSGEVRLFGFDDYPVLRNMQLTIGFLHISNTSVDDIERMYATLSYIPPGLDNLTLDFDYVDGKDKNTFQDEQSIKAGVSLRF